jgi:hypothetical protein
VDTGSREENASKQKSGASVLIQSGPKLRRCFARFHPARLALMPHAMVRSSVMPERILTVNKVGSPRIYAAFYRRPEAAKSIR